MPAHRRRRMCKQRCRQQHDIATLLKIYAHVLPRDDDRVRALVDRTLDETTGEDGAASALS